MGGPSRQPLDSVQFLVHTFERGRKDLLAVQRLIHRTGETPPPCIGFAATLTLLLADQSALLVAQLPQADAQGLEPFYIVLVNCRMVRDPQDLMLLVAEETALEFTGHGHPGITFVTADRPAILPDGSSAATSPG